MSTETTPQLDAVSPSEGRHLALPLSLFVATCLSTFWVGAVDWKPIVHLEALHGVLAAVYKGLVVFWRNSGQGEPWAALQQALAVAKLKWAQGFTYMGLVMALLLAHEMGHFLMTLRHRIPASLPFFIPLPVVPFGTLGAVIGMDGSRANRRQQFDLGIAGPLAGLAVTVPILLMGIAMLPNRPLPGDSFCFHNPLLLQYLIVWLRPDYPTPQILYLNQFNSFLMAGWVGVLITGLNMLPISQLDGGHVAYALLGRRAHVLARGIIIFAILFVLAIDTYFWIPMLVLVILLGTDHPPTADDGCRLGWLRTALGWASLLIPVLCFPLWGITPMGR